MSNNPNIRFARGPEATIINLDNRVASVNVSFVNEILLELSNELKSSPFILT